MLIDPVHWSLKGIFYSRFFGGDCAAGVTDGILGNCDMERSLEAVQRCVALGLPTANGTHWSGVKTLRLEESQWGNPSWRYQESGINWSKKLFNPRGWCDIFSTRFCVSAPLWGVGTTWRMGYTPSHIWHIPLYIYIHMYVYIYMYICMIYIYICTIHICIIYIIMCIYIYIWIPIGYIWIVNHWIFFLDTGDTRTSGGIRVAFGWIQGHWAQHARSESGCDQAQAGSLFVGEINGEINVMI